MAFHIPTVGSCPIATKSQGVIYLPPVIISQLSGAVHDKNEWLAILLGTKSEDGLTYHVKDIYIPQNQTRSSGHCSVTDIPDHVRAVMVGVVHSHHGMMARFSGVDTGPDGVNRMFPMSIVIGHRWTRDEADDPEYMLYGFAYEAEARVVLPCGTLGVVPFNILPEEVEDWPIEWEPYLANVNQKYHSLGDCPHLSVAKDSGKYDVRYIGKCGVEEAASHRRYAIFGQDGHPILSQLPPAEKPVVIVDKRRGKGLGYSPQTSARLEEMDYFGDSYLGDYLG